MSDDRKTPQFQFGLIDLFLWITAAAIWLPVVVLLRETVVMPVAILIALVGITVAVQTLLRGRKHG